MQITQLLNNNCFPGRNGLKPRYVILHGTAGGTSAEEIAQFFKGTENGSNPVSATYVVDQEAVIYQCNLESDGPFSNGVVTAGHDPWWNADGNPNPNNVTISIEFVKPDSANATALTPAQQSVGFALVKDICQRNGIPMRAADADGGICGHSSIDPVNRSRCPGTFGWNGLWTYLNGEETIMIDLTNPTVASHFSGGSDIWQCKDNGFLVGHGILGFYQKFGGDSLCGLTYLGLPLGPETPVLNKAGTTIGVVYQRFERGVLAYDPRHQLDNPPGSGDVYLMHIDQGVGQDPRIAALQAEITALQQQPVAATLAQIGSLATQASTALAKIGTLAQVQ